MQVLTGRQKAIRDFLRVRTCYEVLPLSFRLIELDVGLTVKESLNILVQCGMLAHILIPLDDVNKYSLADQGLSPRLCGTRPRPPMLVS